MTSLKRKLIVVILLLSGCGGITGNGVEDAIEACAPNGGISHIEPVVYLPSDSYTVVCKNGRTIEGPKNGNSK